MKKIRIAQIGTGHDHAHATVKTLSESEEFELVGYAKVPEDRDQDHSERPFFNGVRELSLEELWQTEGLQAVAVETEDENLSEYALEALRHGLAVQMDKPGGQDASFREAVSFAKANRAVFHVGYMYRYNPALIRAKELIDSGELGKLLCVEAQMNCVHSLKKRNWLAKYKGGMMNYLGCHLVDVILRFQGEPERIIPLNKCSGVDGTVGEDIGMAVFEYPDGVSFAKTTAIEYGGFMRRQIVFNCEHGTIEINPTEYYPGKDNYGDNMFSDMRVVRNDEYGRGWLNDRLPPERFGPVDRYRSMFREFAAIVRGEIENPYTYDYELRLHDVLMQACGAEE